MENKAAQMLLVAALLALALLASACVNSLGLVEQVDAAPAVVQANAAAPAAADGDDAASDQSQDELEGDEDEKIDEGAQNAGPPLATASAVSRLSNQPGRAIVSARGNPFVVDSVPPLDRPNEGLNRCRRISLSWVLAPSSRQLTCRPAEGVWREATPIYFVTACKLENRLPGIFPELARLVQAGPPGEKRRTRWLDDFLAC